VVQDILGRTDDTRYKGLRAARDAYLFICGKVPFPELQAKSSAITVTEDDEEVDISSLKVAGILSVRYYDDSADKWKRLHPDTVDNYDHIPVRRSGVPSTFARGTSGTTIEFDNLPDDGADSIVIRYWRMPAITDPNDMAELASHTLVIPVDWEQLLRWEALYALYHYENSEESLRKAQMLVMKGPFPRMGTTKKQISYEIGIIPRLWNDLLETLKTREGHMMDYPVAPANTRPYTHIG
jgi:hypothetical protein